MAKKLCVLCALLVLMVGSMPAQQLPPGYVDPLPLLAAASKEIGEANLRCITFSGAGYDGAVGQTFEQAVNIDWPRIDSMANYTRTINWETGTSKETFDRKPGLNPAAWKYGLGWQGGTPVQKNARQTFVVNGKTGWAIDGDGPPVAASREDAELWQLDIWLNPPGFLKAARLPGANPRAVWRWEQIEMGRDGNVVMPEKMYAVSIMMLGKYRVDATINRQNQIQRIHVLVNEPALGDFNIEHESTNQQTFGNVKWPTAWHSHQGWDDNWQFASASTGHNAYGGQFPMVQPNVCPDPVPVPANLQPPVFPNPDRVTVEKMANGVYMLGGGPANSYMVEFADWVAVFEAPTNEKRRGTTMRRTTVEVPALFERVAKRHERDMATRRVQLVQLVAPGAETVVGDPDRLEQAIQNLAANALRHTPDGGTITLSAERIDATVRLSVRDTGPGIAPEHLPQIFDRFYKVDVARKSSGGSGLGLSIAKAIVESHGGTITARNDNGAVFEILLPAMLA